METIRFAAWSSTILLELSSTFSSTTTFLRTGRQCINFAWVGDVEMVNSEWLKVFLEQGVVPVVGVL